MVSRSLSPTEVRYEPPCHGLTPRREDGVVARCRDGNDWEVAVALSLEALAVPSAPITVGFFLLAPARRKAEGMFYGCDIDVCLGRWQG
jgi:hypothetical protein